MPRYQVCLNAFTLDEFGNETYTDRADEAIGWSVYVRTDPEEGGEFDVDEDHDVPTYGDAIRLADDLARKYQTADIREF